MRISPVLTLLLATTLPAQPNFVNLGDIGVAANTELRVLEASGVADAGYPAVASIRTIVWDPAAPDSFIVGNASSGAGGGQLIRMAFVAAGQVVSTAIPTAAPIDMPMQLSWDQTGQELVSISRFSQIQRINVGTGAVTNVTSGAQPWGSLTCGVMDPNTADYYVGDSSGDLWRVASSGGVNRVQTGLGSLKRILIDDSGSPHSLYFVTTNTFGRVDLGDPTGTPDYFFGQLGQPQLSGIDTAAFDQNGDFLLAGNITQVYRLPNVAVVPSGGIAPTSLGAISRPNSSVILSDIAVVGGTTRPFRLTVRSVPPLGGVIELENTPTPLGFGWILLSTTTTFPVNRGPLFGLMPDSITFAVLGLPAVPGGPFAFVGAPPPALTLPPLSMAPFFGQTWDWVGVAFSPTGRFLGRTNLERVTWN